MKWPKNVVPLFQPMGRWKWQNFAAAALVLIGFFGMLAYISHTAKQCDARDGVLVQGVWWFECVDKAQGSAYDTH